MNKSWELLGTQVQCKIPKMCVCVWVFSSLIQNYNQQSSNKTYVAFFNQHTKQVSPQ